ncbi:MAG: NitT/TauT family transport system permease protein [Solirubrobacteraceae bacterium]|jgi:NitT/TauT family transport system permease protein|nr:NitT/TauT family transport system permease protein [Solirubrobacteraceae bacterium]
MRRISWRPLLLGTLSFAVLIGGWQLIVTAGLVDPFLVASPAKVASSLVDQIGSGVIFEHLKVSMMELAIGFGIATVLGISWGVLMGWYGSLNDAFDPFVWLGYSAPLIALYPVFLLIFGLGAKTVIAICVLLAVFPILVNTRTGVREVDAKLVQAARSFGATDRQLFTKIVLPASLPFVMAGLRLGIGRGLVGVVVGEFFVGDKGLGYSVAYYAGLLRTTDMIVQVVVIGAIGVLLTTLLSLLERRIDSWRVELST